MGWVDGGERVMVVLQLPGNDKVKGDLVVSGSDGGGLRGLI